MEHNSDTDSWKVVFIKIKTNEEITVICSSFHILSRNMNAFYINVILISNLFWIPLYAGLLFLLAETITPAWAAETGLNQQKLAEIQNKLKGPKRRSLIPKTPRYCQNHKSQGKLSGGPPRKNQTKMPVHSLNYDFGNFVEKQEQEKWGWLEYTCNKLQIG